MSEVRERIARGELPVVDGVIPVVVTFHDLNRYTARHTREYLQILLDSARATRGEDRRQAVLRRHGRAATGRHGADVRDSSQPVQLPGFWNWIWEAIAIEHRLQYAKQLTANVTGAESAKCIYSETDPICDQLPRRHRPWFPISVLCSIVESGFEPLACDCTESGGLLRIEVYEPVTRASQADDQRCIDGAADQRAGHLRLYR